MAWIIAADDLAALRHDNAGLARRFFDNGRTTVVSGEGGQGAPPGYESSTARIYRTISGLRQDIRAGRRASSVIYDPEAWPQTPAAEQARPVAAMTRFSHLARDAGYAPIVAPGRDLTISPHAGCAKRRGELLDQAYLRCRLTAGATDSEVFIVQAAPQELDLDALGSLMKRARDQIRAQAPDAKVVATLSTAPSSGRTVWPADLLRAARVELSYADGIMLNMTTDTVPLAASFLRDLERVGRVGSYAVPGAGSG